MIRSAHIVTEIVEAHIAGDPYLPADLFARYDAALEAQRLEADTTVLGMRRELVDRLRATARGRYEARKARETQTIDAELEHNLDAWRAGIAAGDNDHLDDDDDDDDDDLDDLDDDDDDDDDDERWSGKGY